jgi:hypothetical protein
LRDAVAISVADTFAEPNAVAISVANTFADAEPDSLADADAFAFTDDHAEGYRHPRHEYRVTISYANAYANSDSDSYANSDSDSYANAVSHAVTELEPDRDAAANAGDNRIAFSNAHSNTDADAQSNADALSVRRPCDRDSFADADTDPVANSDAGSGNGHPEPLGDGAPGDFDSASNGDAGGAPHHRRAAGRGLFEQLAAGVARLLDPCGRLRLQSASRRLTGGSEKGQRKLAHKLRLDDGERAHLAPRFVVEGLGTRPRQSADCRSCSRLPVPVGAKIASVTLPVTRPTVRIRGVSHPGLAD